MISSRYYFISSNPSQPNDWLTPLEEKLFLKTLPEEQEMMVSNAFYPMKDRFRVKSNI